MRSKHRGGAARSSRVEIGHKRSRMDSPVAAMRPTTRLKQILQRRSATILPGTPNALIGRVIDSLEFEAIYLTGAGIANMSLGAPDIGLVTLTELTTHLSAITEIVQRPVLVDA